MTTTSHNHNSIIGQIDTTYDGSTNEAYALFLTSFFFSLPVLNGLYSSGPPPPTIIIRYSSSYSLSFDTLPSSVARAAANAHVHVLHWGGARIHRREHRGGFVPPTALLMAHLLWRCPALEEAGVVLSASCVRPPPVTTAANAAEPAPAGLELPEVLGGDVVPEPTDADVRAGEMEEGRDDAERDVDVLHAAALLLHDASAAATTSSPRAMPPPPPPPTKGLRKRKAPVPRVRRGDGSNDEPQAPAGEEGGAEEGHEPHDEGQEAERGGAVPLGITAVLSEALLPHLRRRQAETAAPHDKEGRSSPLPPQLRHPYPFFNVPFASFEATLFDLATTGNTATALPYFDLIIALDRDAFEYVLQYYYARTSTGYSSPPSSTSTAVAAEEIVPVGKKRGRGKPKAEEERPGGAPLSLHHSLRAPIVVVYPSVTASSSSSNRLGDGVGPAPAHNEREEDHGEDAHMMSASQVAFCAHSIQQLIEMLFVPPTKEVYVADGGPAAVPAFHKHWREGLEKAISFLGPLLGTDFNVTIIQDGRQPDRSLVKMRDDAGVPTSSSPEPSACAYACKRLIPMAPSHAFVHDSDRPYTSLWWWTLSLSLFRSFTFLLLRFLSFQEFCCPLISERTLRPAAWGISLTTENPKRFRFPFHNYRGRETAHSDSDSNPSPSAMLGRRDDSPHRGSHGGTIYEKYRVGTVIPREIISWLQQLQLSQTIKFPKRDLSNGYLVAEICSLYWPDVNMNSFRNRLSLKAKRDNWEVLTKHFAKSGIPLSRKVVEGMVVCKDQYAESFLRQLYTLLTGKELVDAKPLRKPAVEVDVYNPGALAQQMKSTMEAYRNLKESEEKTEDQPPGVEDRSNGPIAGRAELHNLPDISMPTTPSSEKKTLGVQPIRTFDADNGAEDGETEDGRSGFEFDVEVRAAEHTSTVVKEPIIAGRRGSVSSTSSRVPQVDGGDGKLGAGADGSSATEWVECIVKRFTDDGWRLTPDCPTYMQFLLQHEADLEGSVQGAIWNALLSRIGELVDMIKHNSVALGEVVSLMLVSPDGASKLAAWGGCSTTNAGLGNTTMGGLSSSRNPNSPAGTSTRGSFEASSMSGFSPSNRHRQNTPVVTSPRVFMFLAAVLSHLTDLDPFYALSAFIRSVITFPSIQMVLRHLNYHLADMYASLLCSVMSSDQDTAVALLPDLLSAAYESITGTDNSTEAKMSFLVLLRAIITRTVRPGKQLPPVLPSDGSRTPSPPATSPHRSKRSSPATVAGTPKSPTQNSAQRRFSKVSDSSVTRRSDTHYGGSPTSSSQAATDFTPGSRRDLSSDLHVIASVNAITALSSESVQVRMVGAAVVSTLASTGYPVHSSISQFKQLLFPRGAGSIPGKMQPVDHVVRAMWLRSVQERLTLLETRFTPESAGAGNKGDADAVSPTRNRRPRSPARGRRASHSSSYSQLPVRNRGETTLITRDLLPLFHGMAQYLMLPGGHKKSKTLVAFELAISLLYLPIQKLVPPPPQHSTSAAAGAGVSSPPEEVGTADSVAGAVMTFFIHHCTADLINIVVAPPSDSGAGAGGSTSGGSPGSAGPRMTPNGFGRGKEVGCIIRHPILGHLCVQDMLRRTCSVMLCRALYKVVLPPDLDAKDAARRLGVRAAGLARERVVPPDMLRRLQWIFWIVVSGRGFEPQPEVTAFVTKAAMRRRWREVLFESYDDIALITSAAETLMTQRQRMDDQAQSIIELGAKARRVVFRWHAGLGPLLNAEADAVSENVGSGSTSHKKSFLMEPNTVFEESAEKLHQAMDWFHNNFNPGVRGDEDGDDV
eukprot:gene9551-6707_t